MEREIKFKAWHKPSGKMYWFDLMWGNHGQGNGYIGMVPWGKEQSKPGNYRGNMILVDPTDCEIMQYTGLKDKNGKEIYEGDVVREVCTGEIIWDGDKCTNEVRGTVIYAPPFFDLEDDGNGRYLNRIDKKEYRLHISAHDGVFYAWKDSEVIGNIYEHPQLMKHEIK